MGSTIALSKKGARSIIPASLPHIAKELEDPVSLVPPVLSTIVELLILGAVGFLLRRLAKWPEGFFPALSRLVVTIALPVYLFVTTARTSRNELSSSGIFPAAAVVLIIVPLALSFGLLRLLRFRGSDLRVGAALGGFGNAGYLPLAVIEIVQLTEPALARLLGGSLPSLYVGAFLLVYSPTLWSAGNLLLTRGGERIRLRELVTPPFIGVAVGFLVAISPLQPLMLNEKLPLYAVYRALDLLGDVTFPLVLITLGAMIGTLRFRERIRPRVVVMAFAVAAVRLIALPGLFFALYAVFLRYAHLAPAQLWVLFLEATVPPATNFSVMAGNATRNEDQTAFTLLVAYALYLVALPLLLFAFLSLPGILPPATLRSG